MFNNKNNLSEHGDVKFGWVKTASFVDYWNRYVWEFDCDKTGLKAIVRTFLHDNNDNDDRLLNTILEMWLTRPVPTIYGVPEHDIDIVEKTKDNKQKLVAKWNSATGNLVLIKGIVVIKQGYGLKQAIQMSFMLLAEKGLLTHA